MESNWFCIKPLKSNSIYICNTYIDKKLKELRQSLNCRIENCQFLILKFNDCQCRACHYAYYVGIFFFHRYLLLLRFDVLTFRWYRPLNLIITMLSREISATYNINVKTIELLFFTNDNDKCIFKNLKIFCCFL